MSAPTAEVVICGAGIAGVAAAYHLAVRRGIRSVVLVDERPPLSLTSDKSAESYRNWWPGPGDDMVALMNRSIDLLEELARESDNVFLHEPARLPLRHRRSRRRSPELRASRARKPRRAASARPPARSTRRATTSPRRPTGFEGQPTGTDVITDRALIRRYFPLPRRATRWRCCTRAAAAGSAASSSGCTCSSARASTGVRLVEGRVEAVETRGRARPRRAGERRGRRPHDRDAPLRERGRPVRQGGRAPARSSSCRCSASATPRSRSTIRSAWCRARRR